MDISAEERKLFELECEEYRELLAGIRKARTESHKGLGITCIGNAGGSDSIIHGKPSGGMLVRYANRCIIVDPGENSLGFLTREGFDPYQITDVIATHAHNDHIGDLTSIVAAALQLNLGAVSDTNIMVSPSLVDYGNPEATRFGFTLPAYAWKGNVNVLYWQDMEVTRYDGTTFQSVKSVSLGENIKLTSTKGKHAHMPVSGFIISTPMGKIGYTGDTEFYPSLAQEYEGVDILWMNMNTLNLNSSLDFNCAVPKQVSSVQNHLGYIGVCELIDAVEPRTAIVSHFGSQLLQKVDDIQKILRKRYKGKDIKIYCAHTGDEFTFDDSLQEKPGLGNFRP